MITESFYTSQVEDICFVPIHINYERLVEAEVYPNELLGVPKRRESLSGLIEARSVLSEDFGRISIKIDKPISLKDYTRGFAEHYLNCYADSQNFDPFTSQNDRRLLNLKLGHRIIFNINCQAVWSAVALVSSILLANRYGIPQLKLVEAMEWLQAQLISSPYGNPDWLLDQSPATLVEKGLAGLTHAVLIRRDGVVIPDADSESCLMLSIYKNKTLHAFMRPAAVSLAVFCCLNRRKSSEAISGVVDQFVNIEEVVVEAKFTHDLLDLEIIYKEDPDTEEDFIETISLLVESEILTSNGGAVAINTDHKDKFMFYCHILWPLVESYWVTGKQPSLPLC